LGNALFYGLRVPYRRKVNWLKSGVKSANC